MSNNSMVSVSSSTLVSSDVHDYENPHLKSIRVLVVSINQHILELLANAEARTSLKLRCTSKLRYQKQEFFEFSEHSVLANFYWGIDGIEAAIQTKWPEEKASRLRNSEQMLQVPALLDEQEITAGIPNSYLVCCSYFYLAVVGNLQKDEWQAALHFLQALLVSPKLIRTEFAPELCENLFPSCGRRSLEPVYLVEGGEDDCSESMRQMARRYKDCLMYYQVMLYGKTQRHSGCRDIPSPDAQLQYSKNSTFTSTEYSKSIECGHSLRNCCNYEKVHPLDPQDVIDEMAEKPKASIEVQEFEDHKKALKCLDQAPKRNSSIKCLQDMLKEYQSDTPTSVDSCNSGSVYYSDIEGDMDDNKCSMRTARIKADNPQPEICYQKIQASCSTSNPECTAISSRHTPPNPMSEEVIEAISELNLTILEHRDKKSNTLWDFHVEDGSTQRTLQPHKFQLFDHIASTSLQKCRISQGNAARNIHNLNSGKNFDKVSLHPGKDSTSELLGIVEKTISRLCFSEGLGKCDEDYAAEVTKIYEMLNSKAGVKYSMLKDVILDQLLEGISTSKEERIIRASVTILITIISANKSVIEDIKKKGLQLHDLVSALKQNVYEAAILIYLVNPSPEDIKTLELLPTLLEIVCTSGSYKNRTASLLLTPPTASLMIIKVFVTAFDCATNNMHLAAISSPHVLCGLLDVARNNNLDEFTSLATILIKCMQFDGQCRKYISEFTPVAPFIILLQRNEKQAKFIALEFFHEVLRIPRSSAISLLQRIQKEGGINIMHMLMHCIQQLQPDYQLLAANLLLQLDTLDNSFGRSMFKEEAMQVLLKSLASEESSDMQLLSAFILSNLGGTYAWTGEPYTVAWLVKKAGLTSVYHRNMIRNFNWLDQCLQDAFTDSWCSRIARSIINIGNPIFHALEKGLNSKITRVSRACLTAIAWLGCEITKSPNSIKNSAREILLSGVEQFLHPGMELEDRLLACLCIYNYTSGKEQRISCVHTQILEAGLKCSGAVCALIYYKGLLYSGYSDGSIKVWDIRGQSAILVWDMKEHKKAVTCFSLFEAGDSLLSGSTDKTIRVWQMLHRKLECIEVIAVKDPIQHLDAYGEMIFVITHAHRLKVFDASRTGKNICKSKNVKCMRVVQEKIYIGCTNSSIQEFSITNKREQEIKAPAKGWKMQNRPINSIVAYKDWLYIAGPIVEGSHFKEWKRHGKPQMSIATGKGENVLQMQVVEDFIYVNCSSSTNNIQIWLRGTQQKVGRISAGSRITSLLTANDIVLCGTETGLIKGWIPL